MDNRLKTLIVLSPGFPKNEADSTCIPPQQVFVRALKETYPNLNIIVLAFQYPFFTGEYNWHGVKVIAFGGMGKGKLLRAKTWLRVHLTLLKLYKQHEVIGLLSFWLGECAIVAGYFARLKSLRHYCWLLGQDAKAGNKYVGWVKPKSDELIALSDFITREFAGNYKLIPKHVIPVGIDKKLFKDKHVERDIDILGAGSLIPLKQYHLFVEAIGMLKLFFPGIKAVICGDGPEKEQLTALIKSQNLEDNIILKGELPHEEVLVLMKHAKVLLHPSAYEGFGAVCLEALYAGAKVVSFVKPMDAAIQNWHIINDMEDALQTVRIILNTPDLKYQPVMPYDVVDNVKKMMGLFGYEE